MTIEELLKPATKEQIRQIESELTPERIDEVFKQAGHDMKAAAEAYAPPTEPKGNFR